MDTDIAVATQVMSSAQQRKIRKPLVERKRRNRINGCLDQMKDILIDEDPRLRCRASKLEKADILELVLEHMQNERNSSHSTISMNKVYEDGYKECLHATLACLNEMGMITNPWMNDMLENKLIQHLLQIKTKNSMTSVHPGVDGHRFDSRVSDIPGVIQMPCSSQVPMPDIHSLASYGLSQEIQMGMPYFKAPGNSVISKVATSSQVPLRVPHANVSDNSSISQLSPTVITNQMSAPYADAQFLTVSSNISQSLSKSRFVPYKNKTRPALQNKNVCSSVPLQTLPTTTERVRNETVAWSLNDDICYSIELFPSKSDQPQSKVSVSKSHKAKKLQEKTRSESMAMPRKCGIVTQRPLSTNDSTNVEMRKQDLQENVLSKSMADGLDSADATQGHLVTKSFSSRIDTAASMRNPDKIEPNPRTELSIQSLSEELNEEDIWRPF